MIRRLLRRWAWSLVREDAERVAREYTAIALMLANENAEKVGKLAMTTALESDSRIIDRVLELHAALVRDVRAAVTDEAPAAHPATKPH